MDREKLVKEIKSIQESLESLSTVDESYIVLTEQLEKLFKMLRELDAAKLESDKTERQLSLEEVKVKAEADLNDKKIKQQRFEAVLDIAGKAMGVAGMIAIGFGAIYAEETRIITSKAWQLATRLLPKI